MIRASLLGLLALTLTAQAPAPASAAPAAPAEAPAPVDAILARIGTRVIRQSELDAAIAALPAQQQQQLMLVEGARERYVQQYLEMTLLAAKAERDGLDRTPAFQLKVDSARNQLLATELLHRDAPGLQALMDLKDEEVLAHYQANQAKFTTTGQFSARHILVSVKSPQNPEGLDEAAALAKVAKVEKALKAGKKLKDLAKTFSDDPGSKDQGGLYENIPFGKFVPEFEKAVLEQQPGKPGKAIRTPFGFHIIQVEKVERPAQQTFEQAKDRVRQILGQARQEQVWAEYITKLKGEIPFQMGSAPAADAPKPAQGGLQ